MFNTRTGRIEKQRREAQAAEEPVITVGGERYRKERRRRAWRILRRMVLTLIVLFALFLAVVQVVLWSDFPRRYVIRHLETQLGLRVTAAKLDTGWSGKTTLRDVTISLPLAEDEFLKMPELKVAHTPLPVLLVTQRMNVKAIGMESPTLVVSQNRAGRWNVSEVVELLRRVGGGQNVKGSDAPQQVAMALPRLAVSSGTLRIEPNAGDPILIAPVTLVGEPIGRLVWRYDLEARGRAVNGREPFVTVRGEMVPGGVWQQDIHLAAGYFGPWVAPWVEQWPEPTQLQARWQGAVRGDALVGQLDLSDLVVQGTTVTGLANVQVAGGGITATPAPLRIRPAIDGAPEIHAISGIIGLDARGVRLEKLRATAAGGQVEIDGRYGNDKAAEVTVAYRDIMLPRGWGHSGRLSASLREPWPGQPKLQASLETGGRSGAGEWNTKLTLNGEGRAWDNIDWTAKLERFAWLGTPAFEVHDVTATLATRGSTISLGKVETPGAASLSARGAADLAEGNWSVYIAARDLPVPKVKDARVQVTLDALGDRERARVTQASVTDGRVQVSLNGEYLYGQPKPVDAKLHITRLQLGENRQLHDLPLQGRLRSDATLTGTLWPMKLDLGGRLYGEGLIWQDHKVGDVDVDITGTINHQQAVVETREMFLLGGKWRFSATYPQEVDVLLVRALVEDLPLARVARAAMLTDPGGPIASGNVSGTFTVEGASLDLRQLRMRGEFSASDVLARVPVRAAGDETGWQFAADKVAGKVELHNGTLVLTPLAMQRADGRATIQLSTRIDRPELVRINGEATEWPIDIPGAWGSLRISSRTKADIDFGKGSATGQVDARVGIRRGAEVLASVTARVNLQGRSIHVPEITGEAFGGTARGLSTFDFDQPLQANGQLVWEGLDARKIAQTFPQLKGFDGITSGRVEWEPAKAEPGKPVIEPMKLTLRTSPRNMRYRSVALGKVDIEAYMNLDRAVLHKGTIAAAGGEVKVWGRVSAADGRTFAHLQGEGDKLSIDQLVRAVDPDSPQLAGTAGGTVTLLGRVDDMRRMSGHGSVRLRNSDLSEVTAFQTIYALLGALPAARPEGRGWAAFRLESGDAVITSSGYYNRGVDMRLHGSIKDVLLLPHSGINLTAVGSTRPFRDLRLPIVAEVDQITRALQSQVTTIKISGTVKKPTVTPILFKDIDDVLRRIILEKDKDATD